MDAAEEAGGHGLSSVHGGRRHSPKRR
jgi:hypothetical protein